MTEDATQFEKREELKRRLIPGNCKTLTTVILDGTGDLIKKLTRNRKPEPLSPWHNAAVLALVTWLIAFLASVILGEFDAVRRDYILLEISVGAIVFVVTVASGMLVGMVFTTLRENLVDAIESVADLTDLERWLSAVCDVKKQLFFGLAFSMFWNLYSIIFFAIRGVPFFGLTISGIVVTFLTGVSAYVALLFFSLSVRLGRYQLKLYAADPTSSEVLGRLSDLLANLVYVAAIFTAIAALVAVLFRQVAPSLIFLFLGGWGIITAWFIANQYTLIQITTRAKRKKLSEIQARIEKLEAEKNIADQKTIEAINRLMDYHDRIKATRNSMLDFRAVLSFLNSLLLPLIAFLLGNLDKILALLKR